MKSLNSPFLSTLNADDVRILFPDTYYAKYATHLKILQFQNQILAPQKTTNKLQFKSHQKVFVQPSKSLQNPKANRYDDYATTIKKNKQSIIRMNRYAKQLQNKLSMGPTKRDNLIRVQRDNIITPSDFILTSAQVHQEHTYQNRKKLMLKKSQACHFIKKSKSDNQSEIINWGNLSKIFQSSSIIFHNKQHTSSQKQKESKMQQQLRRLINKSQLLNKQLNPQIFQHHQRSYIMNINNALKQTLKIIKKAGYQNRVNAVSKIIRGKKSIPKGQTDEIIKNLQLQTQRIRHKVQSLKTIRVLQQNDNIKKIRNFIKQH